MKHTAGVTVGAERLGTVAADLVGVADLEWDWGRDDLLSETPPHTARIVVIDRTLEWSAARERTGEIVAITREPGGLLLWQGAVSKVSTRFVSLPGERPTETVDALEVTIIAQDALARAMGDVSLGPSTNPNTPEGLGGWIEQGIQLRVDYLRDAGLSRYVTDPDVPSRMVGAEGTPDETIARQRAVGPADAGSLGEHLTRIMRCWPLGFVNIDPTRAALIVPSIPWAGTAALTLSGSVVRIMLDPATTALEASKLAVDEGIPIEQSGTTAVDLVRAVSIWYGPLMDDAGAIKHDYTGQSAEAVTAVGAASSTRRTFEVKLPTLGMDPSIFTDVRKPFVRAYNRFIPWWLAETTKLLNGLGARVKLPPVTIHFERVAFVPSLAAHLWSSYFVDRVLYLSGALTNLLPSTPRHVLIVGGTFRYDADGWHHTVTFAAAPETTTARASLPWSELFPSASAATWAMLDPAMTWPDLAAVTKGLT